MRLVVAACVLLANGVATAGAQVGYPPSRSPYRDIPYRQQLSFFGGYFFGNRGSAGVAPTDGPLFGARYEIRVGGPAHLTARVARSQTERRVLDPTKPADTRELGTRSWPIYLADIGIALNLTGQKSWRKLVPLLHGGVGVASDVGSERDVGGFKLGTSFAFTAGGGVRWAPGGRYEARLDLSTFLYQIAYPGPYFQNPVGGTAILAPRGDNSEWKLSPMLSIGVSYLFAR